MATATNLGNQNRVFRYKQELSSEKFNRIFSKTFPPGVYEGGDFTRINATSLSIAPLSVIIEDSNTDTDIAVRIRTTETVTLGVTEGTLVQNSDRPLIVLRYTWAVETENNYMAFVQVSETVDNDSTDENKLWNTDLILAKINFDSSNEIPSTNSFDYTWKTISFTLEDFVLPLFKVRAPKESEDQNKVYVEGGYINSLDGRVAISGQYSIALSDTTTLGRKDYIYIDEEGAIQVEEGTPSASPATKPFYGRKVLAVIERGSSRDDIKGDDIVSCHLNDRGELKSTTILLNQLDVNEVFTDEDADGFITLDDALRQLWVKSAALDNLEDGRVTDLENDVVYKAGVQIISGVKTFSAMPKVLFGTTLAPTDNAHLIPKEYYDGTLSGYTEMGAVKIGSAASPKDQEIYGIKTFIDDEGTAFRYGQTKDGIILKGRNNGTNSLSITFEPKENLTGDRTISLPDGDVEIFEGDQVTCADEDQTILGKKEFQDNQGSIFRYESTKDGIRLLGRDGGSNSYYITLTPGGALSANRTITLPNGDAELKAGEQVTCANTSQTILGLKEFQDDQGTIFRYGSTKDGIKLLGRNGGVGSYYIALTPSGALSANRTISLPDGDAELKAGEQVTCADTNQSVDGIKTFVNLPKVPTTDPVSADQVISKTFLDKNGSSNGVVHTSGAESIADVKTFTSLPKIPSTNPSDDQHPVSKKYYDDNTVKLSGTQAIADVKTFTSLPKIPSTNPSDDQHPISKKYYDDNTVKLSGTQIIADVKTFSSPPVIPITTPGSTNPVSKSYYDSTGVKITGDQEIAGVKTFLDEDGTEFRHGATKDGIIIKGIDNGTTDLAITIKPIDGGLTANRTVTLPDGNVDIKAGEQVTCANTTQTILGVKTFDSLPVIPITTPGSTNPVSKSFLDGASSGVVHTSGAESIADVKTFTSLPVVPTDNPASGGQVISKSYFDSVTVKLSGTQTIADVKTFSSLPVIPITTPSSANPVSKSYLDGNSGVVHTTGTETIGGNKTFSSEVTAPSFDISSLRSKKENFEEIEESALDIINNTKIVHYNYKSDKDKYKHTGFIADDSHDLLTGKNKDVMALSDTLGMALKAIQELSEENKKLKERIEKLERIVL
jgi:hypothetical protein